MPVRAKERLQQKSSKSFELFCHSFGLYVRFLDRNVLEPLLNLANHELLLVLNNIYSLTNTVEQVRMG